MAGPNPKIMYGSAMIGYGIQGTIGDTTTYRLRHGNGHYGSVLNELYQDKFARVVPSSIDHANGEPYRANLRAAILHWQYALSAGEKAAFNRLAEKIQHLSGYNLFLRRALKGEVEMFVDRGDPATYDFEIGDFTKDDAWHDLSLATIIPLKAKLVLLDTDYNNNAANRHIELRKNGQTNNKNHAEVHTRVAAQDDHAIMVVAPDVNRIIEYKVSTTGWSTISMTIRGWWI